jgi:hypothetical protein
LRERENHRYGGDHTGLPCAVVLRLIGALLGEPSRLPPSQATMRKHRRQLDAGTLGRQDHTTSPSAKAMLVSQHLCVHHFPASRLVTIAIRPSSKRGGMRGRYIDSTFRKTELFFRARIDMNLRSPPVGQISSASPSDVSGENPAQRYSPERT